ncbi:MAG: hypothetical protein JXB32_04980 [Deltaproteobacteria bacterium]|nr:hypothetical protein [Deltaproteobacteria bacterium]
MRGILLVAAACLLVALPAAADAPAYLPVQGVLADDEGAPVDGEVSIRFALYTAELGGTELWFETQTVLVEDGLFTAYLGDETALGLELFRDHGVVWLGVKVDTDPEMNRFQVATTGFAAFAQYAGDAASLGGTPASEYRTTSSTVDWTELAGVPAELADGLDADTTYSAGAGLTLTGTEFAADQAAVEGWARGACYDTVAELRAELDTVYADAAHVHGWSTLTGVPAGFADGVDDDTTYDWSTLPGIPAGFADGVDDDTNTTYTAGSGLALTGTQFSADTAVVQARVAGTCAAGSSIRVIDAAGNVTCETDDDTAAPGTAFSTSDIRFYTNHHYHSEYVHYYANTSYLFPALIGHGYFYASLPIPDTFAGRDVRVGTVTIRHNCSTGEYIDTSYLWSDSVVGSQIVRMADATDHSGTGSYSLVFNNTFSPSLGIALYLTADDAAGYCMVSATADYSY